MFVQRFFLFILILLAAINSRAVSIRSSNTEYAGKQLVFYRPADPVTNATEQAFILKFDASGKAQASVDVKQTEYVFSDFGIYSGMLFLEPGKDIVLKFPPLRERSFADMKNPYFEPVSFWFISESGLQLNDKISAFEQRLNYLIDKNFNKLYILQSKPVFDSVKVELDQMVPSTARPAMINHKNMKLSLIEADIFRKRPESYSGLFTTVKSSFWLHPAFIELFNKTFDKQLSFSAQAIKGDEIKKMVETRDLPALISFAEKKYHVSGQMTDLVLLKMLHDAFYSNEFSKAAVKDLVVSERFIKNTNALIQTTAKNITEKITFLQPGNEAPVICLEDLSGRKVCTNSGKEKFKYLVFADAETMVCREHLKYLSRIDELFGKNLDIFVILRDTDLKEIKAFFEANKVPGTLMVDKGDSFIKEYKIRSFPQCFLLDEEHRVAFENVKAPLEGFEQQFGDWLRNELFMRQRNQKK